MKLFHIVAMAENRVIGRNGKLPWHFSSDLKFFKQTTMGQTVIMGRKTFESIGKPLPGRENFVLTGSETAQTLYATPEAEQARKEGTLKFFDSIERALRAVKTNNAFIIGGAQIFNQTFKLIDGIYLTKIHTSYEGDVFYLDIPAEFKEKSRDTLQENPKLELIYYEK